MHCIQEYKNDALISLHHFSLRYLRAKWNEKNKNNNKLFLKTNKQTYTVMTYL